MCELRYLYFNKRESRTDKSAVFENPNHDFPKRLIYTRKKANKMIVEVKGEDDKGFQIIFKREND